MFCRRVISTWTGRMDRINNLKTLMMSFIEIREEGESSSPFTAQNITHAIELSEQARGYLLEYRDHAVRSRSLRLLAAQSITSKGDELLANAFLTWKGRFRERRLEPRAREVEAIVEDGLMFAVWDRWISRSTVSFCTTVDRPSLSSLTDSNCRCWHLPSDVYCDVRFVDGNLRGKQDRRKGAYLYHRTNDF